MAEIHDPAGKDREMTIYGDVIPRTESLLRRGDIQDKEPDSRFRGNDRNVMRNA
jgi:hypothetical protein